MFLTTLWCRFAAEKLQVISQLTHHSLDKMEAAPTLSAFEVLRAQFELLCGESTLPLTERKGSAFSVSTLHAGDEKVVDKTLLLESASPPLKVTVRARETTSSTIRWRVSVEGTSISWTVWAATSAALLDNLLHSAEWLVRGYCGCLLQIRI